MPVPPRKSQRPDVEFEEFSTRGSPSLAKSRSTAEPARQRGKRARKIAVRRGPAGLVAAPDSNLTFEEIVAESKRLLTACPIAHIHDVLNEALAIRYLSQEQAQGLKVDLRDAMRCLERMRAVFRERHFSEQCSPEGN